jgi:hypothetical protein
MYVAEVNFMFGRSFQKGAVSVEKVLYREYEIGETDRSKVTPLTARDELCSVFAGRQVRV